MHARISKPAMAVGMSDVAALQSVAERVNFRHFQEVPAGAAVRVAGTLEPAGTLTTIDGGRLALAGAGVGALSGFVELVGRKAGDGALTVVGGAVLGKQADAELWDEAVRMTHLPQLRHLFQPADVVAAA